MATPLELWSEAPNVTAQMNVSNVLPTGTDTTIGDATDAINASGEKQAGSMIFNSTDNTILVSIGALAVSPWHTAAGVEDIVPS